MKLLVIAAIILVIYVLAKYFSIIIKRTAEVFGPLVMPHLKKFYDDFVKLDEKIAGTDRKPTGTAYNRSDRYVDVKNPYKRVSYVIMGMLLAVLALYINKPIGILLLTIWLVFFAVDILRLPFRGILKDSEINKIVDSGVIQLVIAVVIFAVFESEIRAGINYLLGLIG